MGDKVSDVGKKMKLGGIRAEKAVLDLKGFGFASGHDRKQSESEANSQFTWPRKDILIVFA